MTKVEREELRKATNELRTLNLPMPREVKSFYKKFVEHSAGYGYDFAEYVTEYKGRLLQRIFCYQMYGLGKTSSMREMARRYENGKLVLSNVCGGWYQTPYRVRDNYSPKDMAESGWIPSETYIVENGKRSFECPKVCINEKYWLKKYPYCAWDKYKQGTGSLTLFQFIKEYRKNPKIELLIKAGYPQFVGSKYINVKGKNFEEIFGVKQEFAKEYLKKRGVDELKDLKDAPLWVDSEERFKHYRTLKDWTSFSDDEKKYLVTNGYDYDIYRDYLRFAEELGYPISEKSYHYPTNLKKAHDSAEKNVFVIRNKEKEEGIAGLSKACQGLSFEQDGYSIFPLSCAEDLINESKALHHCVRTYVDKVADHNCLIMFVRKSDDKEKPFVTLELIRGKKTKSKDLMKQFNSISQVRAINNSVPDDDVSKFIMAWKNKFKLGGWSYKEA